MLDQMEGHLTIITMKPVALGKTLEKKLCLLLKVQLIKENLQQRRTTNLPLLRMELRRTLEAKLRKEQSQRCEAHR